MFEIIAHVLLYALAGFGVLFIAALIVTGGSRRDKALETEPVQVPQPLITNLRPLQQPASMELPQVLSKTTMQITTTRYMDPAEGKRAVADGR